MKIRGFEPVVEKHKKNSVPAILPIRGSRDSAGYDFASPVEFKVKPYDKALIWTDVKAYMQENEVLKLYPRSSLGIKKGLTLANTVGIVDRDYHSNESNDGNIGICLYNNTGEEVFISAGERIAQGIFTPFLVSDNGNTEDDRVGGIGSTNKS